MKLNFRQRLFLYFAILFAVFAIGIVLFVNSREKTIKTDGLKDKLDVYANVIYSYLSNDSNLYSTNLDRLKGVLPNELRITVIDMQGNVLFENAKGDFKTMENHSQRTEIKVAKKRGSGTDIRKSESTNLPYLYYAKKLPHLYIRVALPYDIQLHRSLKTDNLFIYFIFVLFVVTLFAIHEITKGFGNSIKRLRDFALNNESYSIHFDDDELGEIGTKITENYHQLKESEKVLFLEKQKLLQHVQISEEGICFISSSHQVELYNGLFIQYLNQMVDDSNSEPYAVLKDEIFAELHQFLELLKDNYFETKIHKQGKIFSLRANLFEDKSFEIIFTDITQQEKTKLVKKEMTGNIAHELRTPITSIRAYLETILEQSISEKQKKHFIKQAYLQALTLSEMIKDMSIIAKIEEVPNSFELQKINIFELLEEVKKEEIKLLKKNNIQFKWQLTEGVEINGNANLLKSIFRNLIENSINYAGKNVEINISIVNEDKKFYYFSFYDTGVGISDELHLNRIFERFYRVQEGRTRATGGSGLGLAIVKNAVLFHKGMISAKNRKNGGLEFLFSLRK